MIECHELVEQSMLLVTGAGIMLRLIQVLEDSEMPLSSGWAGAGLIANMRRLETIVKQSSVN